MKIPIQEIKTDGGTQMRITLNDEAIKDYIQVLQREGVSEDDWPFDSKLVVFGDGQSYFLADGFHRLQACETVGRLMVDVQVIEGTIEDAQDYALQANSGHGLRRSNEDKRKAVEFAMNCERWSSRSDRVIANHIGVSNSFVGNIRESMGAQADAPRKGADGKSYKKIDKQPKQVIDKVVPTPAEESEGCDPPPMVVDWKIKHKKTIAITEQLMRALDELNQYKPSNQKGYLKKLIDSIWEGLKKW